MKKLRDSKNKKLPAPNTLNPKFRSWRNNVKAETEFVESTLFGIRHDFMVDVTKWCITVCFGLIIMSFTAVKLVEDKQLYSTAFSNSLTLILSIAFGIISMTFRAILSMGWFEYHIKKYRKLNLLHGNKIRWFLKEDTVHDQSNRRKKALHGVLYWFRLNNPDPNTIKMVYRALFVVISANVFWFLQILTMLYGAFLQYEIFRVLKNNI